MSYKKWIKLWLLIILIIPIVGLFNYNVDSLGIVKTNNYLDDAAKELAKGKIVAGLDNFDDRLFRKKTINYLDKESNWVAIGSSRTMQLRERMFLKEKGVFQNYSVSGASLEDYIALLQAHYNKYNRFPKNIIFGIDPWIFNKRVDKSNYMSLYDEYAQFLANLNIKVPQKRTNYINKIFSLEYTIENAKFLKKSIISDTKRYYIANSIDTDDYLREPDGSIQYKFNIRNPDFESVKQEAILYASGNIYLLEKFTTLSKTKIFEKTIQYLLDRDIKIYFFLPSYNPYTYDKLMERKYHIVNDIEEYLKNYAKQHNIKVIGSYNPHNMELTNEYFFDAIHTLDNAYEKIFKVDDFY